MVDASPKESTLQLVAGPSQNEAKSILIFVHGLHCRWEQTWSASDVSSTWLRSLPDDIPKARVFAYGYNVLAAPDMGPGAMSRGFFDSIQAENKRKVPVILVAHSLGGLIVQDAMSSYKTEDKSSVLRVIRGIIFLGTPCFSQDDDWALFLRSLGKIIEGIPLLNPSSLSLKSAQLGNVCRKFSGWREDPSATRISIWSFYEILPVPRRGGIILPQESAIFSIYESSPLRADHLTISKIDDSKDPRYRSICAKLTHMMNTDREISENDSGKPPLSSDNREEIIDAFRNDKDVKQTFMLALALEDQGRLSNAQKVYNEVIESWTKPNTRPDEIILYCKHKVACILRDRGYTDEAMNLCKEAMKLRISDLEGSKKQSKGKYLMAQMTGTWALVLRDQGDYQNAYGEIQKYFENETIYPYNDIAHIRLVGILSKIVGDLNNWTLSLLLARNVLSACQVLLGRHDPFTLEQASNLALVISRQRERPLRLAEEIDRRVLDTLQQTLGSDHPQSLCITTRLAKTLHFQGKYQCAVKFFQQTLNEQETLLEASHPDILSTKCGLAATYALQHRWKDSEILLNQVNDCYQKHSDGAHAERAWLQKALKCLEGGSDIVFKQPFQPTSCDFVYHHEMAWRQQNTKHGTVSVVHLHQPPNQIAIGEFCGSKLNAACLEGDEKRVNKLLTPSAKIDAWSGLFGTPLHAASFEGHGSVVQALLKAGADPNSEGNIASPLRVALMMNHENVLEILLEDKANLNVVDQWFGTPLHEASLTGQVNMVQSLLNSRAKLKSLANPNIHGGIFGAPLLASAWEGNDQIVKSLLDAGADFEAQEGGKTAWYLAEAGKHVDVIKTLYQAAKERHEKYLTSHPREPDTHIEPMPEHINVEDNMGIDNEPYPSLIDESVEKIPHNDKEDPSDPQNAVDKPPDLTNEIMHRNPESGASTNVEGDDQSQIPKHAKPFKIAKNILQRLINPVKNVTKKVRAYHDH